MKASENLLLLSALSFTRDREERDSLKDPDSRSERPCDVGGITCNILKSLLQPFKEIVSPKFDHEIILIKVGIV